MADPLRQPAVGVQTRSKPPGLGEGARLEVSPERGRVVEADLQPVLALVQPELLVGAGRAEGLRLLRVEEEVRGPRTLDVVDRLELVLDLVDEPQLQLGNPPPRGSRPASTSTVSRVSLPVRRQAS